MIMHNNTQSMSQEEKYELSDLFGSCKSSRIKKFWENVSNQTEARKKAAEKKGLSLKDYTDFKKKEELIDIARSIDGGELKARDFYEKERRAALSEYRETRSDKNRAKLKIAYCTLRIDEVIRN